MTWAYNCSNFVPKGGRRYLQALDFCWINSCNHLSPKLFVIHPCQFIFWKQKTIFNEKWSLVIVLAYKLWQLCYSPAIIWGNGNFTGFWLLAWITSLKSFSGTIFFNVSLTCPSTTWFLLLEKKLLVSSNERKLPESCLNSNFASGISKCTVAWIEFDINSDSFFGLNRSSGGTYMSKLIVSGRLSVKGSTD